MDYPRVLSHDPFGGNFPGNLRVNLTKPHTCVCISNHKNLELWGDSSSPDPHLHLGLTSRRISLLSLPCPCALETRSKQIETLPIYPQPLWTPTSSSNSYWNLTLLWGNGFPWSPLKWWLLSSLSPLYHWSWRWSRNPPSPPCCLRMEFHVLWLPFISHLCYNHLWISWSFPLIPWWF